jgi:hypothetical protein
MTDPEINAAIAAHVGWKSRTVIVHHSVGYQWDESLTVWTNPEGRDDVLPSYTTDLNAMHEAEKVLGEKRIRSYAFTLAQVLDTSPTVDLDDQFLNIHATASQRSEALLRTFGKWKEAKL